MCKGQLIITVILLVLLCYGCQFFSKQPKLIKDSSLSFDEWMNSLPEERLCDLEDHLSSLSKLRYRTETVVRNLSWIQTALIVGGLVGLALILLPIGMKKIGGPLLVVSIGGYFFVTGAKSIEIKHDWIPAVLFIAFCICMGIYALWRNRIVFREIIAGGEVFKKKVALNGIPSAIGILKDSHDETQKHKFTRDVVEKVQRKVNGGKRKKGTK